MKPEAAVAQLAEIIATRTEFNEDELYTAMTAAGIPDAVADRAYKFTQIAWGRVLLDGMGIRFSPNYLCLNAAGEIIESGLLANQPYFVAAMGIAKQSPPVGLPCFGAMSADVNTVNSALNAGSKPEDLATGLSALFMEPPTPDGMVRARQVISSYLVTPTKKPWWRFW